MQLRRRVWTAVVLAGVACTTCRAADCPDGREPRTVFGRRSEPEKLVQNDKTISVGSQVDRVRYFRLQIRREPDSTDQGVLVVKDNDLRVVDVFRLADLSPGHPVWTRRGSGNQAMIRFVVPEGQKPRVTVVRSIGMSAEADQSVTYYSLQVEGQEQYRNVYPSGPGQSEGSLLAKRVADSVGFLQGSYEGGQQTWCCSAVAIDTDLVLTNWHCGGDAGMQSARYWSKDVCEQTMLDMSWDGDTESREYQCARVVADPALDLALMRVTPIDHAEPLVPLPLATTDTVSGAASLLHHPQCRKKQVTETCRVEKVGPVDGAEAAEFTHNCDSEGGSSGGPLYDRDGQLIGLHHAGFRRDPTTCKPIDKVNRGIRLAEVKAFVARARAQLAQPEVPQ